MSDSPHTAANPLHFLLRLTPATARLLVLLAALLLCSGLFLVSTASLVNLEERLGARGWTLSPQTAPEERIIIVAIDEASLAEVGPWPWARDQIASLVDAIDAAGAQLQLHDIVYPEARPGDDVLLASLQNARGAVIGDVLASLLAIVLIMTVILSCMMSSAATVPADDPTPPEGKRANAHSKAVKLLADSRITVVLGALFAANAAISCLEATIGMYATRSLGLDTSDVGFLFMVTAIPSVIGAKLVGTLGALAQGRKRWRVALGGMLLQGGFFAAQAVAFPGVSVVAVEERQPVSHSPQACSITLLSLTVLCWWCGATAAALLPDR